MLKDLLIEKIISKPDIIQFAKDRKYEESWIIPIDLNKPTDIEIDRYLAEGIYKTLIVEYIWNSQDDENRFVLTLFQDKKCKLQDQKKFIKINLNSFYEYLNFNTLVNVIDLAIIGRPFLFQEKVDSVNLGIFNHWLSVGPVKLWQQGDSYDMNDIIGKIKSRQEIETTNLNYQGLLFQFNVNGDMDGPYYGLKTPCCRRQDNRWVIDYQKVNYWMQLLTVDKNL